MLWQNQSEERTMELRRKTWNSSLSLTSMVIWELEISPPEQAGNVSDHKALVFLKLFVIFWFCFLVSILYMHAIAIAMKDCWGVTRDKSCRLQWINYLRPDVKRGNFSVEEEETITELHQSIEASMCYFVNVLSGLKVFGFWQYFFAFLVSGGQRLLLYCQDEQTKW